MREQEFLDAVSHIEADVVESFVAMDARLQRKAGRSRAGIIWTRIGAVAACFAVVLSAVLILPMLGVGVPEVFDPPFDFPFPGGPSNEAPSPPQHASFDFDSYEGMIRDFKKSGLLAGSESIQGIKDSMGETYAAFVDKVAQDGEFPHPMLNGQPIPYQNREGFSNVTFFPDELYGLPWVWYHCLVEGERVNIQITYPACKGVAVDPAKDVSEMLKAIAPNAVNPDNYKDRPNYEAVYLQSIPMATGEVGVLVYELKDRIMYTFFMGDAMVIVTDYEGVMTHPLWRRFSVGMGETSAEAGEDDLLEAGDVTRVTVSSLPGSYAYAYEGEDALAIVEYLDSLSLRSEFEEDPDEYVGMTWVIAVDHADGSTITVYHFGNMFIRAADGPWYRMEYEEAARFHALLDELNGE
ncbi:MAG: hypothetical protein J6B24_13100 [Clostridia bacterium]|nr:hypothetical protein [Clostridia bacterium]